MTEEMMNFDELQAGDEFWCPDEECWIRLSKIDRNIPMDSDEAREIMASVPEVRLPDRLRVRRGVAE